MASVNVYLIFNGNCEEAFTYYKSVFGGEFAYLGRFKDMPATEGQTVAPEEENRIMHVSLPISKETILMGSDTAGEWASKFKEGNNFSLSVAASSKEEANKLFSALSTNGIVKMPLADTFWGSYFGMLTDKFGINWQVGFDEPQKRD
jgi:PhnB protein